MAKKIYVPGLRAVLNTAYRYGTRYNTQLEANLTEEQFTCLGEVISAIGACLVLLGKNPIS